MRSVRATRIAIVAWMGLGATGCLAWRVESVPPRDLLRGGSVPAVRVTKADKSKVEIWSPKLVGDSIIGHPSEVAIARLVMPLSQVQTIATKHRSFGRTLLIGAGVVGAVGAYALLQSLNPPGY
jgi:hypothetical protein